MKVADIGGKRNKKRGLFNINDFDADVTYVNIDSSTEPDIKSPAESIPVSDESYDIALMGELLEHVFDPRIVLKEAFRILKPGGKVVATVPFLYPVHADPEDYGRYTDYFWKKASEETGFRFVTIEEQGSIFAVMALMVQHIFRAKHRTWKPVQYLLVRFLMWLDVRTSNKLLRSWTTGYGLILSK